jgi:hypothetical protein
LVFIDFNLSSGAAHPYNAGLNYIRTMDELLAQLDIAQSECDEAVGEVDQLNAQRKVEWLLFCMDVYNQRHYFGDMH